MSLASSEAQSCVKCLGSASIEKDRLIVNSNEVLTDCPFCG